MSELPSSSVEPTIWQVGALCRAVADALQARFNPVTVRGEIASFSRAASGHCYFSLKDDSGQLRCAMFRRAAESLEFTPRDGELVQLQGRLDVYEPRGDLQLIVHSISRAGAGAQFERFLQLKSRLEAEGLFAADAKRALPFLPRGIGVVTSLGAAALHDVVSVLRRRAPHVPVLVAPASVQGASAPQELVQALFNLYSLTQPASSAPSAAARGDEWVTGAQVDVILLVRGGGSVEDLWAFNDEQLARCMARSPVPIVCGIGHETDFTIADFVADLRAPTPTAAAELVVQSRAIWLAAIDALQRRAQDAATRQLDQQCQQLDALVSRLGRPSAWLAQQRFRMASAAGRALFAARQLVRREAVHLQLLHSALPAAAQRMLARRNGDLERSRLQLGLLDPGLVLRRGYAWLTDTDGQAISSVRQIRSGQLVRATFADGEVDLVAPDPNQAKFLQ